MFESLLSSAPRYLSHLYRVYGLFGRGRAGARTMAGHRNRFYAEAWRDAAEQMHCSITPLGYNIFEISDGSRRIRVCRNDSPVDDSVTLAVAGNKVIVYRILDDLGIPVPRHLKFDLDHMAAARDFLAAAGGPVAVKPAFDTGAGAGVTVNVRDARSLMNAAAWARAFCPELIVEQQIDGDNYRLLYLDGELLDCVLRRPPVVTGDGQRSIRQLIAAENAQRLTAGTMRSQVLLTIDLDLRNTLRTQGLSLDSIPDKGSEIKLKQVVNDNRGDENETAVSLLSPSVVEAGRQILDTLGIRLGGVDIITRDPGVPLAETGGVVIDVNTTPGFYYHYFKCDGSFPVATHILRRILKNGAY